MSGFIDKYSQKMRLFLAATLLFWQVVAPISPFIGSVYAGNHNNDNNNDNGSGYSVVLYDPNDTTTYSNEYTWLISGDKPGSGQEISNFTINGCWTTDNIVDIITEPAGLIVEQDPNNTPSGTVKVDSLNDDDTPFYLTIVFNEKYLSNGTTTNAFVKTGGGSDAGFAYTPGGPNCDETEPETGSITIVKDAEPLEGDFSDQAFNFSATGVEPSSFTLDDDNSTDPHSNSKLFTTLQPDTTYTFTENETPGWELSDITCTGASTYNKNLDTRTASVTLGDGEIVTCTFTNTEQEEPAAYLTLAKVVVNEYGGEHSASDWRLRAKAHQENPVINEFGTAVNNEDTRAETQKVKVEPGKTYNLDETNGPSGYTASNWVCNDLEVANAQITLQDGDDVTCVITNTQNEPPKTNSLTIAKVANPNHEQDFEFTVSPVGSQRTDTFYLDDDGDSTVDKSNRKVYEDIPTGRYVITETEQSGWALDSIECNDAAHLQEGNQITVFVGEEDAVECTFTNVQLGGITINKATSPEESDARFEFEITNGEREQTFYLDTNEETESISDKRTYAQLPPDTYQITEQNMPEGWTLDDITCDPSESEAITFNENTVTIELSAGDEVSCTFENVQGGQVIATKFHDLDQDGVMDENEPGLSGWSLLLDGNPSATGSSITDSDGQLAFDNVSPGLHQLSEVLQDGWNQSGLYCGEPSFNDRILSPQIEFTPGLLLVEPGETVRCFIGNYQDLVLQIEKSNDQPTPTVVGDTVQYTLEVTVPETSGISYDTCVTDLPPEGFAYNGNWTASSSVPTHAVSDDVTGSGEECGSPGGPDYSSPGQWYLGTMLPGEVVTLTYETTIQDSVPVGDYPDIAFVEGNDQDEQSVLGLGIDEDTSDGDPFVNTSVSIIDEPNVSETFQTGQVLGARFLPNTGTEFIAALTMSITAAAIVYWIELKRQRREYAE